MKNIASLLDILPGTKIRHYKGREYVVVCWAEHSENLGPMVVYQTKTGLNWARPTPMFMDLISWPDGIRRTRFVVVT